LLKDKTIRYDHQPEWSLPTEETSATTSTKATRDAADEHKKPLKFDSH
jgi:hypothetical protein